jgi:hypothetical protein
LEFIEIDADDEENEREAAEGKDVVNQGKEMRRDGNNFIHAEEDGAHEHAASKNDEEQYLEKRAVVGEVEVVT